MILQIIDFLLAFLLVGGVASVTVLYFLFTFTEERETYRRTRKIKLTLSLGGVAAMAIGLTYFVVRPAGNHVSPKLFGIILCIIVFGLLEAIVASNDYQSPQERARRIRSKK